MPKLICKIQLQNLNFLFQEDKKTDKKSTELRKSKVGNKYRQRHEKSGEKSRHTTNPHKNYRNKDCRYSTEKNKLKACRLSRARIDVYDKNNRNYRKNNTCDILVTKRYQSFERNRDRSTREPIRIRDKRRKSECRLSDRKLPSKTRSLRSRHSLERELQHRFQNRNRDRPGKLRESGKEEKPRESESNRNRQRYNKQKDSRRQRNERRHSRTLNPGHEVYRKVKNTHTPNRRFDRENDFSTTNIDLIQSPIHSSLRELSLEDLTASESESVVQLNIFDGSNEYSPAFSQHHQQYYPHIHDFPPENHQLPSSPKRISLDDRINLVLGIEKEPPKPIDTVCTRGPFANSTVPNYDPYGYSRSEYDVYNVQSHQPDGYVSPSYQTPYQPQYYLNQTNTDNNVKILQVGNLIQVIPREESPEVNQVQNIRTTVAPTTITEKPVIMKTADQLAADRRAEKTKRRQERDARSRKKEKRKEKEKRRKQKTKTENMMKRALMLQTGDLYISTIETTPAYKKNDNSNLLMSWPPVSSLTTVLVPRLPGKSILISYGFRNKDKPTLDDSMETRKVVKFADGICPGEGTSHSGGAKLPSPPPPRKLSERKRCKRVHNNYKYEIEKQIIRMQHQFADYESSEEDNLPPPPPPPGSPPVHLWPPRIKHIPVNI